MFSKKYVTILFICLFLIPTVDGIFNIFQLFVTEKSTENRSLAEKPVIDLNYLDGFPEKYETYYNDHFMLRNLLTKWYSNIKINHFKISPIPNIAIFGKNDWLYYTGFNELATYKGENTFNENELKKYLNELKRRKNYLEKRNCELFIFIVPTKLQVYPEYIGKPLKKGNRKTNGELLTNYVKKNSDISITYLLPNLLEAKNKNNPLLYYHTDNHWTQFGAFIGYSEIMKQINKRYNFEPIQKKELIMKDTIINSMGIAAMMGIKEKLKEATTNIRLKKNKAGEGVKIGYPLPENYGLLPQDYETVKEVNDSTLPRLVVIRDSFTESLIPFLSQHFSRSNYIFDSWQYNFNETIINTEKPNIVIYEIFEPHLRNLIGNN